MGTSKGYIPPKNQQWRQAKGAVTRMMRNSGGSAGVSKAISRYADAYMSTHLGNSKITTVAGGVMNFISAANKYGVEVAAKNIGLGSLLNKKGGELYKDIIDYFARDISTTDMQIIRESLTETLVRLEIEDFKDFEKITNEEFLVEFIIQFAIQNFETCFSEKIFSNSEMAKDYDRVMEDIGLAIENRIVSDIQLDKKLDLDYASPEGQQYISSICKECYENLRRMEESYEDLD